MSAHAQTAGFTADRTGGCAPLVVHFTNTSTGAASYRWYFGNSTPISYLTNPSTSYLTTGTYTCKLVAINAAGTDSSSFTMTITVYPDPTVSFVASETSVCPGAPVTFSSTGAAGVPGAISYEWNFGDGDSSSSGTPSHGFATSGYKNITLTVTNSEGCQGSVTVGSYIDVYTPPVANFTASPMSICNPPGSVTFTSTSTGTAPMSATWTTGDGGVLTGSPATHSYSALGYYTISLTVTDAHGCEDSLTRPDYIEVGGITGSFTSPATACVFSPVIFTNTTPGGGIASNWSFGTGATSSATSPVYSYNAPGTYTVTLVVYNGHCYDTVTHSITILPEPVSTFTWTPTDPCPAPATITFTGTAPAGSTEAWTFGDGTTGTGATDVHTYAADGSYNVTMIVTNSSGCKDTVTHVEVLDNLVLGISHIIDSSGCVPLTVPFTSYVITTIPGPSSSTYPYAVTSYTWDFGDGSPTSSLASPSHTYTAEGTYTATLTIITANGCTQTTTKTIEVGQPPVAGFTAAPTTICDRRDVTFTNTTTGATSYLWNFGDGYSSTDVDPTHLYVTPDTFYTVTLIAYYNGCPDTFIRHDYITVDSPKAIIADSVLCSPRTGIYFMDSSLGDYTHEWFFGDGTTSTAADIIHSYPTLGLYTVMLTTYNATSGCRDTTTTIINLTGPTINIIASDTAVCKNAIVDIHPVITGGLAVQYGWTDNVAAISGDSLFIDTFRSTGIYTITLTIKDQTGCYDTFSKTNYIVVAKPAAAFSATPTSGCWPLEVTFTDESTDTHGVFFTNFAWTFGDGGTGTTGTPSISHLYTAGGTFPVKEIVTDNIGCKDTVTLPSLITVYRPAAAFTASNVHPCIGAPIVFTNSSAGIVSSFWMFGDGTTSTTTSPTHTYYTTGSFTVKLAVVDVHGCSDTAVYTSYINVTTPDAGFYMTDSFSLCPPMSVNFINTTTGASTYFWYLGDGSTSILPSPSDVYTTVEYDTVLLIAKNTYGCLDTAIGHVELFGNAGGFSYGPLSGCVPLTVRFGATISNVPNIIWDFNDGTTTLASYADSATHTYTIPGAYVPKLILSDNTGCENSSLGLDTIKIDGVKAGFTTVPDPVCLNVPFTFNDTSSSYFSMITTWHWSIAPNGDSSSLNTFSYTYTVAGTFPVTLEVTDGWGCRDTVVEPVGAYPPPVITVSADTTVCVGDAADLTGYGGVNYTWAPAATVSCTLCGTTHASPTVVTQYTVTGTDSHGCQSKDTVSVFLRIYTTSQGWGDTAICYGTPVPVNDTGGTKYTWIPAGGLSNTHISNPVATPATTTTYTVIAQLASCIPDTNFVTVIVHPLPTVNAGPDQTIVAGDHVVINANGTLITQYSWSPDNSLNCSTCASPIATPSMTTTYMVDVSSEYDCRSSDTVTIHVVCEASQVFVPNSFTPNNDGENDVFYPRGTGISIIKAFRIYNRWGELLFEKSNININDAANAWDGAYQGGTPRPDVYVYIIDAVCETGEPINLKGDVTIIR